jgi:hypothetical protein
LFGVGSEGDFVVAAFAFTTAFGRAVAPSARLCHGAEEVLKVPQETKAYLSG